ncbi:MAG: DUF4382 domain-containing protein [Gammaproteobacteria bacterium]|nr:DUF4382 domain-containing protein [Gammaproteobacteria bacterium]
MHESNPVSNTVLHQRARSSRRRTERFTESFTEPGVDIKCHVWNLAFLRDALIMLLLVAGTVLVTACGGGGSGSGAGSGSGTGTVALLFTDLPTDEFDQILVDVREIRLLSDNDGQVTIFEDTTPGDGTGVVIDLLALQTHAELFTVAAGVPAGTYNKIRLYIYSIELIDLDDPDDPIDVKLPANGKIDLNPRGDFILDPGQTLLIELDMDANRSIQYHQTGRGEWRFRPVVFVDIPEGLVRISGTVTATDPVMVCEGAADDTLCVTLDTNNAALFGPDGTPLEEPIVVGDEITAIGFLFAGETEGELVLDTRVVQIGNMYERVAGTVESAPLANNGTFGLLVDTGSLTVELQPSTQFFNRQGEQLADFTAITVGLQADIDGVRDATDTLLATLVVLDTAAAVTPVAGTVATANGGQLTVITDTGDRCVDAGASDVFTVAPDSNTEGDAGDIEANETIEAYGTENSDGCLSAGTVIVTAD